MEKKQNKDWFKYSLNKIFDPVGVVVGTLYDGI